MNKEDSGKGAHNKKIAKGIRYYGLKQIAKMTLGSGNIEVAVELTESIQLHIWKLKE